MAPQLAWIGLGNMGRGICKNLVEKGSLSRPLVVYNRTTKRSSDLVEGLGEGKAMVAESIHDAVKDADIVFTCVATDAAVNETIDAAVKLDVAGKLFVDCSTVHPDTTKSIDEKLRSRGAEFVACPVFGPPAAADSGQLVCVPAGPKISVEKVKPYTIGVMGRAIIDFSDLSTSHATMLKVIGNSVIINVIESLAEGHVLSEKCGLGSENLHKFIEAIFPGLYVGYSNRMLSGDYYKREEPLFGVDLARKDAGHALELAEKAGVRLGDIEVADEHFKIVKEHMGARGDITGIYGAIRKESGLKFEN